MSTSRTDSETPWRPPRIVVGRVGRPHGLDGAAYLDGYGGAVPLRRGPEVTVGDRAAVITDRRGTDAPPILPFHIATDRAAVAAPRGCAAAVGAATLPEPHAHA